MIIEKEMSYNCSDNGAKGRYTIPDYKNMYFSLFNAVKSAIDQLQKAQRDGENEYIESEDMPLILPNVIDEKTEVNE